MDGLTADCLRSSDLIGRVVGESGRRAFLLLDVV